MPPGQTKSHGRKHILAFRLSQSEYQMLTSVARYEKRKVADMVYLIVSDALESYAKRLGMPANPSSSTES